MGNIKHKFNNAFVLAVKTSVSRKEVFNKMGWSKANASYKRFDRWVSENHIDISHFSPNGRPETYIRVIPDQEVFLIGVERNGAFLKRRMLNNGFTWECSICKITTWLGLSLTLEVDHINGNRQDNRKENLRFLCPNCHSQTDTFRGRNRGRGPNGLTESVL